MSLEVIETGEVVEPLSRVEAERLTARIADKLDSIADNLEQVLPLIGEALTRDAWKALDYADPSAYVSERFAGALTRLPRQMRVEVVKELSAAKMSTRAIAPIVGANQATVTRDLATDANASVDEPRASHGMDGKTRIHQPKHTEQEEEEVTVTLAERPKTSGPRKKDVNILSNVNTGLTGYVSALDQMIRTGLDESVTAEEADALHADLTRSIKALNQVSRMLKVRKES